MGIEFCRFAIYIVDVVICRSIQLPVRVDDVIFFSLRALRRSFYDWRRHHQQHTRRRRQYHLTAAPVSSTSRSAIAHYYGTTSSSLGQRQNGGYLSAAFCRSMCRSCCTWRTSSYGHTVSDMSPSEEIPMIATCNSPPAVAAAAVQNERSPPTRPRDSSPWCRRSTATSIAAAENCQPTARTQAAADLVLARRSASDVSVVLPEQLLYRCGRRRRRRRRTSTGVQSPVSAVKYRECEATFADHRPSVTTPVLKLSN